MTSNTLRWVVLFLLTINVIPIFAQDQILQTNVDSSTITSNKRFVVESYWDKVNFNNHSLSKDTLIQKMQGWGLLLKSVRDDVFTHSEVNKFLNKAFSNDTIFEEILDNIQDVFYDFLSPARDFEAYIAVLDWMLKSDKLSDIEKLRPKYLLEMALKNRKGEKANDFNYYLLSGEKYTLHSIESPYTLIFFNSPGCSHCVVFKKELASYNVIDKMITDKQLVVLGVYADDNPQEWRDGANDFPQKWINSIDKGLTTLN